MSKQLPHDLGIPKDYLANIRAKAFFLSGELLQEDISVP